MIHRDMTRAAHHVLGLVGFVLLVLWLIAHATGCGWLPRAAGAVDTVAYERDLSNCMEEAHDAGHSFAVFDRCAHEVDIKHGLDAGRD